MRIRRSVRGDRVDEVDRILLIRYQPAAIANAVWAAPGGGVEPGETPEAALRRELAEEIG